MPATSSRSRALAAAAICALFPAIAIAQQFTIGTSEVSQTAGGGVAGYSYTGPNTGSGDRRGAVLDGGSDAYDDAGYYLQSLSSLGLTLTRRTDTLSSLNVFRWLDTFTRTGGSAGPVTITMESNLGSDSLTVVILAEPFRSVSRENRQPSSTDPILGMMHGNNGFALGAIQPQITTGDGFLRRQITINLALNQSVTFMFADFLARDLTDRSGDINLALNTTAAYLADPTPLTTGLSQAEINRIANWTIPTPSASGALALFLLTASRRRRQTGPLTLPSDA